MNLRLKVAHKLAEQAGDDFSKGRAWWLTCADEILALAAVAAKTEDPLCSRCWREGNGQVGVGA